MSRYTIPKIYYQTSIEAHNRHLVSYFRSMVWENKMNNLGKFELIVPKDFTPFTPVTGAIVYLEYEEEFFDTYMVVDRVEEQRDKNNNRWYSIGGKPLQFDDESMRDAQNGGFFLRNKWNGQRDVVEQRVAIEPAAVIVESDIISSRVYEDTQGGLDEIITDHRWGTTVTSQPKPKVYQMAVVWVDLPFTVPFPVNTGDPREWTHPAPNAGQTDYTRTMYMDDAFLPSNSDPSQIQYYNPLEFTVGAEFGENGYMNQLVLDSNWIVSDQHEIIVVSSAYVWYENYINQPGRKMCWEVVSKPYLARRIKLKTESQMLAEMQAFLDSQYPDGKFVGSITEVPNRPNGYYMGTVYSEKIEVVKGGHKGYALEIKSFGEVASPRYNIDFFLGDTLRIEDEVLGVNYEGVLSGVIETLGENGYNIEFELGTLGATINQRLRGVI